MGGTKKLSMFRKPSIVYIKEREVVEVEAVIIENVCDMRAALANLRENYFRVQKERKITPFVAFDCEVNSFHLYSLLFTLLSISLRRHEAWTDWVVCVSFNYAWAMAFAISYRTHSQ